MDKVGSGSEEMAVKTLWFNMRQVNHCSIDINHCVVTQEPVVYVNGQPYTMRDPEK